MSSEDLLSLCSAAAFLRRAVRVPVAALACLASITSGADAQTSARGSYTKVSPNGKYVFVMIAPLAFEGDVPIWLSPAAAEIRGKRTDFPRSGLYRNDGSTQPLWSVEWYSEDVDIASDGIHVIRYGSRARLTEDEAVTFFAHGRPLATYRVDDFVDFPRFLPRAGGHVAWRKSANYDDHALTYALETQDGNQFLIDVRTGAVIESARPYRTALRAVLGAALLAVLAWAGRTWWQFRRHQRAMAVPKVRYNG